MSDAEQEVWAEDLLALVKQENERHQKELGAVTESFNDTLPHRAARDPYDLLRSHSAPQFPVK